MHLLACDITGEVEAIHPQEFNNTLNEPMYELGRIIHCHVRSTANMTDPHSPPNVALQDYDFEVFRKEFAKPLDLVVPVSSLFAYFRRRTSYWAHRELVRKHLRTATRERPPIDGETGEALPDPQAPEPIFIDSGEGQLLFEILNMPKRAWRTPFQVVFLLRTLDMEPTVVDAYDAVFDAGWPRCRSPETLRSWFHRGCKYLREKVKDLDSLSEAFELKRLYDREGIQHAVPWAITEPGAQQAFISHFGGGDEHAR
jgi:hypothetical protein